MAALVAAVVVLAFAGRPRSERESDDASAEAAEGTDAAEPVAMDRAQREDLEQRAAKESEERDRAQVTFGGGLAVAGLVCTAFGVVLVALTLSAVNTHKKQLHEAASGFVSVAVDGPQTCQQAANMPIPVPTPVPVPAGAVNPKPYCPPSPRDYTTQIDVDTVYTEFTVEKVFSSNFHTDGEVTFHDTLNHRALCVRVPDTASSGSPDSFISSGACPDAPVTDNSTH